MKDSASGDNFSLSNSGFGPFDETTGTATATMSGLVGGDTYSFRVRRDLPDGTVSGYVSTTFTPDPPMAPGLEISPSGALVISYGAGDAVGFYFEYRGGYAPGPAPRYIDVDTYPYDFDVGGYYLTGSGGIIPHGMNFVGGLQARVEAKLPSGVMTDWSDWVDGPNPSDGLTTPDVTPVVVSSTEVDVTVHASDDDDSSGEGGEGEGEGGSYSDTASLGVSVFLADESGGNQTSAGYENAGPGDLDHTFQFTGLTPGHTYYVTARAAQDDGEGGGLGASSAFSDESTATIDGATPVPPAWLQAVPDPQNGDQVDLHWANSSNNEDHFKIYRYPAGTTFDASTADYVGETSADQAQYEDDGLTGDLADDEPMDYAVLAAHGTATSRPATAPVPQAWSIYLLRGDNSGQPVVDALHESVGCGYVDATGKVHISVAYSFGVTGGNPAAAQKPAENSWLGYAAAVRAGKYYPGKIYRTNKFYTTIVSSKGVTIAQKEKWRLYMNTVRVGTADYYDPVLYSCIEYSGLEYANAPDKKP
jgi:hypothetical protein